MTPDAMAAEIRRLSRRLDMAEQMIASIRSGVIPSDRLMFGTGQGGPIRIEFVTTPTADDGSQPYIELDTTVIGEPEFVFAPTTYPATGVGRWLTRSEIALDGALSGTTFAIEDANGNPLPLERETIVLVSRNRVLYPSTADASLSGGSDFTVDADGVVLTTTAAPIDGAFFIAMAQRRRS